MAELGQQTVPFSTLVSRAADESFLSLKELVEKCRSSEMSDSEKKIHLLKYIFKTKQRILRLNVLAKWCLQVPLIQYCQQLASTLSSHDTCFAQAADSLFFMHEGLPQARAPIYDVPSAIEVLLTGSYERLPKCVEDVGMQSSLNESQQKPALKKLDILLRSRLLEISLPKEISEIQVSNGTALMRVDGEFKVLVTLGYRGHVSLWRILHLELLVGERSGPVKLEELRRLALGDDLERRMAASESPFSVLYSVLHELCVALIMDTVIRQVQALRQGRWKDAIRFELISDGGGATSLQISQDGEVETAGHRIPGVKVMYWLDLDKNTSSTDTGPCPFIKIEPGSDLQINCVHSTFVIDPTTGKEAEFCLDHNCIDVEKLLLKAINCNIYTRLLEIHKELLKNGQLCQAAGDVVLECQPDETDITCNKKDTNCAVEESGQEVLRVRAYGLLYFILGINIRSGRYLLQSSGNVIAPSALSDSEDALNHGTLSASEVFITLRSKSILHLFASVGRFLGLEVYEHGFSAVKVPKNILSGSSSFLMGFPDFSSCYFLLTELDRDFKPVFKLLETEPDQSGKSVTRFNKIDVSQMQMLEDEMNLSILDWKKLVTFLSRGGGPNLPSEHGLSSNFSLDRSMPVVVCSPSSFSSVVDEVFELEKGTSAHSVPAFSSSLSTPASYFGSLPLDLQNVQANSTTKFPGHYNNSLYPGTNFKGLSQATSVGSLSSATVRSNSVEKLSVSKSDQDLTSLRSPQSVEARSFRAMDEDHLKLLSNSSREIVSGTRSSRPAPRPSGPRASENLLNDVFSRSVKVPASSSWATTPVSQAQDLAACMNTSYDAIVKQDKNSRKRTVTDMLNLLPSLLHLGDHRELRKRRKLSESPQRPSSLAIASSDATRKERCSYGDLIAEANKGNAPSSIYFSALLHVVRHCSLCIKHARLTSQMEELDIPYVEEVGLRNTYSNIWFGLSSAGGNSWHHICLRLGKPGSMYWDVKINDQHFRDLWELQKGSNAAPWGFGVRIANTSDVDSHIRYDSEGVVLSYPTVEADSIRKLVADIRRLSNARMFALGMRKLLGVRTEEKPDEVGVNSDGKTVAGGKGIVDGVDKLSEQMRRAFRIEAVGLTSVWFSFGSGVLARFVVEWESGKEGCTMHVSPDQLWPHTKFLEDFINGGEVTSLLDCIRLTAGPLHALAAATRPARAGQPPTSHGVSAPAPSISKQTLYASSPGLLPGASITSMTNLANHGLPGPTMLGAGARSGSGIVPSSLLPIDVSVVLRGPYWIRIIYRKDFAVDMRCFAGDQVWLQPATPPKGGPSNGGSLPCPQFRPFIMEHVAQELNGLEPNFTTVASSNNPTSNSSAPVASSNGNRVNLLGNSTGLSRTVNQVAAMNRQSNSLSTPSSLAGVGSGMGLRRSPGTGVPAHVRGELNTAIIGLGDDGGYGGGWVPLVALKKVLRGILKYLGVLWLFAQLPDLLKEILGSILKENEGALLNLDQEQPALRFFVGGYVFAVSVHRVQLLLQVLSVKRFHQQQQQQQQNLASAQEELTQSEIGEICDYFSRRVASEPYDASRVASFITLLTLPISVLREFLKLITWKKGISQAQGGDVAPAQKPRIELCLENHAGLNMDGSSGNYSAAKSNVHYDRAHNAVDFALTVVLDPAHIPHISAAGGAAWLPYCASVRLRYSFGENPSVMFLGMEGSHGGRACWLRLEDWEKSKQRVARTVEVHGSSPVDINQGRLRLVADHVQRTLHLCLQGLRDGGGVTGSTGLT